MYKVNDNIDSLDIIYDNEKFEEAVTALEYYAEEHQIKYHTFKVNHNYDIKLITNRADVNKRACILTSEPERYKNINSYKKIYINENPFRI